jgi:hypothetical protein
MRAINNALLSLFLLTACAAEQQQPVAPQAQVPFDASRPVPTSGLKSPSSTSGLSAYTSGKGLSVPHRPDNTDPILLSVRPDALRVRFAVRAIRPSASEALRVAEQTSAVIAQRFQQELHATTTFRGLSVTEIVKEERVLGIAVTADGSFDVLFDPALDFWKRNALHVRVVELTKSVAVTTATNDETLAVRFHAPAALVIDPEGFRPELVKRWVARARAFAEAAQSPDTPLAILDCNVPPAIEQNPISVDEVQLSLHIRCRIDTPTHLPPARLHEPDGEDEL